ncbi:MAG: zinc-ribbon domain-containing protein [Deltaproteobacteria bacterium]|nr:zinc-ribbon domain-containing protein [Deltaproteobacteria bacterium]
MIIQCDRCGTKFRLDDSRITGKGVRVRCTKCQNVFMAAPPPPVEEIQLEDIFGAAGGEAVAQADAPRRDKAGRKSGKDEKRENLAFDFREGSEGSEGREAAAHEPVNEPETEGGFGQDAGPDTGSDRVDSGDVTGQGFEFSPEGKDQEEKTEWGLGDEKDDFSFGFEGPEKDCHAEEERESIKEESKEEEDDINFSFDTPELVKREAAPSLQGALAAEAPQTAGQPMKKRPPFRLRLRQEYLPLKGQAKAPGTISRIYSPRTFREKTFRPLRIAARKRRGRGEAIKRPRNGPPLSDS